MGSAKLKKIMADDKAHLFQNYGDRMPVCFVRGEDSCLFDQDNRKYIDFFSGIAVSSLGHRNRALSKALHRQVDSVLHTSNWYYNREQIEAAALLTAASFPGKTLFVNSGTEANEAAIKLARRYGLSQGKNKYRIISFTNSFHGRTYGGIGDRPEENPRWVWPAPAGLHLPALQRHEGVRQRDEEGPTSAQSDRLIQARRYPDRGADFVKEIFHLCGKNAVLTIVDEVQTGVGRTGVMFAYQHYGVVPDILTMAKGLGGGVPVGAIHAKNFLPEFFPRGVHGTTFGGNHLACAAVAAVLRQMAAKSFLRNTRAASAFILGELARMKKQFGFIKDVRGMGLHIGIELDRPGTPLVVRALEKGLVINCTADTVIRIMPPLNIPPTIAKAA